MTNKRRALAAVALAVLMTTSGCAFLTGSGSLSFDANKAVASDAALSESGYEETRVEALNVSRNFTVAGQTREVQVTNWVSQYDREVSLGPLGDRRAAVFAALSTPAVEVAGQSFNPVAQYNDTQLIRQFQQRYGSITVGEQTNTETVQVLGEDRNVSRYDGTVRLNGQDVDVYIHIAKFRHGGDHIVALAVYPQRLADQERGHAMTMYNGLEHDAGE
jgi:hypothetical protein